MKMNTTSPLIARQASLLVVALISALCLSSCNRATISGSKLTKANYDLIHTGMSQTQVENILGAPTTVDKKDYLVYKKTSYRWEDGTKFAVVTFKNDEVDGKDSNLGTQ
jgi:hypothetical protein